MKKIYLFFTLILTIFGFESVAQNTLTLDQAISFSKENSLEAKKAENKKENSYWSYQRFRADLKPSLSLSGTIPNYNRAIEPITQPDGTQQFREISNVYSDLGLSLSQNILWTGGSVFLRSSLQQTNILTESDGVFYAGTPLILGFTQPLFGFNSFKWRNKIEPFKLEESKKEYAEKFEQLSFQTTQRYFSLLLAQINLKIATQNQINNEQVYQIGKGRYNLGKIAENELLQLELNVLSAERDVSNAQLSVETRRLNMNSFIGLPKGEQYELILPEELPTINIDVDIALNQARKNRKQYLSFKRRSLEAERDVTRAKRENSFNVTLTGSIGFTNQADQVGSIYQNTQNQQRVNVGVRIPILDWNRRNSSVKSAMANQRLVENTIQQEEQIFEEEIYSLAKQLPILRARVISTKKGDEIATKRYKISQERYLVANISVTDLNLALQEKDNSKRVYLNALRDFWQAYFQLRMLTMYDFVEQQIIQY
ncbi:TolC family protein [Sediminitomix flava]|uniref:Outer membrane protein TolC n=1 Tax=Sediminitomix flava TaxID=379075 RepID=A0A315Z960_SEDFL|nr:TolC family protein [Sediminitomix flava]PWJ41832.1 outer membrane protein TolC [Sediminitomix flava]